MNLKPNHHITQIYFLSHILTFLPIQTRWFTHHQEEQYNLLSYSRTHSGIIPASVSTEWQYHIVQLPLKIWLLFLLQLYHNLNSNPFQLSLRLSFHLTRPLLSQHCIYIIPHRKYSNLTHLSLQLSLIVISYLCMSIIHPSSTLHLKSYLNTHAPLSSSFNSPITQFPFNLPKLSFSLPRNQLQHSPNWVCPRHRLAANKEPPGGIPEPGQTALVLAFSMNPILPFFFPSHSSHSHITEST